MSAEPVEFEPNDEGQRTYSAPGAADIPSHCCFCGRQLLDAHSIEVGYGPICADKYMLPHKGQFESEPDRAAIASVLEIAPERLREALAKDVKNATAGRLCNKAVYQASLAISYPDQQKNLVIAACQRIALACGFSRVADRLSELYFKKHGIRMVRQKDGRIALCTPYSAGFVNAVRNIQGRMFDSASKCWVIPGDERSMALGLAALSVSFPGQLMEGVDGNLMEIPREVQIPPPPTKPTGAPKEATGESGVAPMKLQKGDVVIDPQGRERIVGWVSPESGNQRVGLVKPGERGYEFLGFNDVKLKPASEVAKDEKKRDDEAAKDATAQDAPRPTPSLAPARAIPAIAMKHQVEGVAWLDKYKTGLLADEPGLGKTMTSCAAADKRVIVVCPAAMRVEWAREMNRWRSEFGVLVCSGTKPYERQRYEAADVIVANYDILPHHLAMLLKIELNTLIVDEAHYAKNMKQKGKPGTRQKTLAGSKRAVAVADLAAHVRHKRFLLTATPIMNRPIELWSLLYMIDSQRWDSYVKFGTRYAAGFLDSIPGRPGKTWNFSGSSNEAELNSILTSRYMLRRTKDILDLPEKSRQTKLIALDDKSAKAYQKAADDFAVWVEANGGPEALKKHLRAQAITKMTGLRHLAAVGKIDYAVDWIVQHAEGTGRPLVVMAHHRDVTEVLAKRLAETEFDSRQGKRTFRVGKIIGGMGEEKRTADKDAFQRGELDVIVCSIQAAGVGLTLTAASEVLFLERSFVPAMLVQAEDRIHRIGQKNKCTVVYLDAAGTIDNILGTMLVDKTATIAQVIDGLNLTSDQAEEHVFGQMFGKKGQATANPRQRELPLIDWRSADTF